MVRALVRALVPESVRALALVSARALVPESVRALALVSARALALALVQEKEMGRDWNYQSRNKKR